MRVHIQLCLIATELARTRSTMLSFRMNAASVPLCARQYSWRPLRREYRRAAMPSLTEWKVPPAFQPNSGDYNFDLDRVLSSVVGLHSIIPQDAFTAETL